MSALRRVVRAIAHAIRLARTAVDVWLHPGRIDDTELLALAAAVGVTSNNPVPCSPLCATCRIEELTP